LPRRGSKLLAYSGGYAKDKIGEDYLIVNVLALFSNIGSSVLNFDFKV
jgi:hypothetical protein